MAIWLSAPWEVQCSNSETRTSESTESDCLGFSVLIPLSGAKRRSDCSSMCFVASVLCAFSLGFSVWHLCLTIISRSFPGFWARSMSGDGAADRGRSFVVGQDAVHESCYLPSFQHIGDILQGL